MSLKKLPFKKVSFHKVIFSENKELNTIDLDAVAEKLPFKRCSPQSAISRGFIPFYENTNAKESFIYSINDWYLFQIMIEEKKVSSSEINFEVNLEKERILKEENRIMEKVEVNEFKENLYNEKLKTAPSSFSKYSFGIHKNGNVIINTTSSKKIDSLVDFICNVFSDYISNFIVNINKNIMEMSTKLIKRLDCKIPEEYSDISFGQKGEIANNGKKLTFDKISTINENIIDISKNYDSDAVKMEFYIEWNGIPIGFYFSKMGIEKIEYTPEIKEYMENEIGDSEDDFEIFNISIRNFSDFIIDCERKIVELACKITGDIDKSEIFNKKLKSPDEYNK